MIDRLSDGDITKHDTILRMPYIKILNQLAYWYYRDKVIDYQNKQKQPKKK